MKLDCPLTESVRTSRQKHAKWSKDPSIQNLPMFRHSSLWNVGNVACKKNFMIKFDWRKSQMYTSYKDRITAGESCGAICQF